MIEVYCVKCCKRSSFAHVEPGPFVCMECQRKPYELTHGKPRASLDMACAGVQPPSPSTVLFRSLSLREMVRQVKLRALTPWGDDIDFLKTTSGLQASLARGDMTAHEMLQDGSHTTLACWISQHAHDKQTLIGNSQKFIANLKQVMKAGGYDADLSQVVNLQRIGIPPQRALAALQKHLKEDDGYAWSWHCNIAVQIMDEGVDHATANRAAARIMKACFDVVAKEPKSGGDDAPDESQADILNEVMAIAADVVGPMLVPNQTDKTPETTCGTCGGLCSGRTSNADGKLVCHLCIKKDTNNGGGWMTTPGARVAGLVSLEPFEPVRPPAQIVALHFDAKDNGSLVAASNVRDAMQKALPGVYVAVMPNTVELHQPGQKPLSDFGYDQETLAEYCKMDQRRQSLWRAVKDNPTIAFGVKRAILGLCVEASQKTAMEEAAARMTKGKRIPWAGEPPTEGPAFTVGLQRPRCEVRPIEDGKLQFKWITVAEYETSAQIVLESDAEGLIAANKCPTYISTDGVGIGLLLRLRAKGYDVHELVNAGENVFQAARQFCDKDRRAYIYKMLMEVSRIERETGCKPELTISGKNVNDMLGTGGNWVLPSQQYADVHLSRQEAETEEMPLPRIEVRFSSFGTDEVRLAQYFADGTYRHTDVPDAPPMDVDELIGGIEKLAVRKAFVPIFIDMHKAGPALFERLKAEGASVHALKPYERWIVWHWNRPLSENEKRFMKPSHKLDAAFAVANVSAKDLSDFSQLQADAAKMRDVVFASVALPPHLVGNIITKLNEAKPTITLPVGANPKDFHITDSKVSAIAPGVIPRVEFFDKAFSPEEVRKLYDDGKTTLSATPFGWQTANGVYTVDTNGKLKLVDEPADNPSLGGNRIAEMVQGSLPNIKLVSVDGAMDAASDADVENIFDCRLAGGGFGFAADEPADAPEDEDPKPIEVPVR